MAVSWTNNATNATSVVVERASGTGTFSVIATLAPDATSYLDTTVLPGAYSYRVAAVNAVGTSAYAGPVTVTVPQPGSTTRRAQQPEPVARRRQRDVHRHGHSGAGNRNADRIGHVHRQPAWLLNGDISTPPARRRSRRPHCQPACTPSRADYSGDAVFLPSSGTAVQTVNKIGTATTVVSSVNPSIFGNSVTFTATVTPPSATGTVQFTIDGGAPVSAPLLGGQASYAISTLAVGAHLVSAVYSGDATYLGSSSATLTQTVGPVLRQTTTVVTSNRVPAANLGQSITFTATVRPVSGTGIPTGTAQFNIDGTNVGGAVTLNAQGRATYSTAGLSAGPHNVIAVYSGSTVFAGGGSVPLIQVVNQAATTTVVSSNRNPSVSGQTVTFTARVTPAAAATGGTVTFTVDGAGIGGPVALDATGRATLVMNTLTVGTHTVSAAYAGTLNYRPSASANLTQTVNKANSRTVVTTSGSPAPRGTTVVFTAAVTAVAPGAGSATGAVQFRVDGVNVVGGLVQLNNSGQAAFATSTLTPGRHTVSAVYAGNGSFNASTSANITQRIV